jgi:hypothetical protein
MCCLAVHSLGCLTIVAVVCYTNDTDVYVYYMLYILTLLLSLVDVLYVMLVPPVQQMIIYMQTYEKIEGMSGQYCARLCALRAVTSCEDLLRIYKQKPYTIDYIFLVVCIYL